MRKNGFTLIELLVVIAILGTAGGKPHADNLKRIRFLEGGKGAVGGEGSDRAFRDPWGNPYQYLVNETPKDTMGLGSFAKDYSGPDEIRTTVLV